LRGRRTAVGLSKPECCRITGWQDCESASLRGREFEGMRMKISSRFAQQFGNCC
jgi:hypothetical protein